MKVLRVSFKKKVKVLRVIAAKKWPAWRSSRMGVLLNECGGLAGGGHLLSSNPGLISAILLSYEGIQI